MVTESFTTCRFANCRTVPEPGYADRGLCAFHEQTGLDAISALPGAYAHVLAAVWDKPTALRHDTGRIHSVFGPSEPGQWDMDALAGEIDWVTDLWAEIVRERAQLTPATGVTAACETLAAHYTALVAIPPTDVTDYDRQIVTVDGPDAVVWLTRLYRRAHSIAGQFERVFTVAGTCHLCGADDLRHRDTRDKVWCGQCRAWWTWDQYMAVMEADLFGVPA